MLGTRTPPIGRLAELVTFFDNAAGWTHAGYQIMISKVVSK